MRARVDVALLAVGVVALLAIGSAPASGPSTRKFVIPALRAQWRDTGLLIKAGASAKVTLTGGDATCHTPSASDCPVGKSAGYTCSTNPVVGPEQPGPAGDAIPYGDLAGKVGVNGKPFAIKGSASARGPGALYLVYNDCATAYGDNGGSYQVDVTGDFNSAMRRQTPACPVYDTPQAGNTVIVGNVIQVRPINPASDDEPVAYIKHGSHAREPLQAGDSVRPGDIITTGTNTALEFSLAIGGRVTVKQGAKIEVTGARTVRDVSGNLTVSIPSIVNKLSRCGKLKEPIEIQENGGGTIKG